MQGPLEAALGPREDPRRRPPNRIVGRLCWTALPAPALSCLHWLSFSHCICAQSSFSVVVHILQHFRLRKKKNTIQIGLMLLRAFLTW